jgi:glycosyltransferase involved in cell wall biosynthesis
MKLNNNNMFATTFNGGFLDERFAARAVRIPVPERLDILPTPALSLRNQFILMVRVLVYGLKYRVLLLFSSRGRLKPEVLACALLGLLPRWLRPVIVLYGEMWEPNQGGRHRLEKWIVNLADRAIQRYFVFSSFEVENFPGLWGVAAEKMRLGLFYTLNARAGVEITPTARREFIFAGGNSFRDYDTMVEAARRMPEYEFVIGSHRLAGRTDLPPNLRAEQFPPDEFQHLIDTAAVVVVPLRQSIQRTAGQLTYLEAMWRKKPVIVSNAPGARDYIEHKKSGFIVDNDDVHSYLDAIGWMLNPANQAQVDQMCEMAHRAIKEHFNFQRYIGELLAVMDEAFEISSQIHGFPAKSLGTD